MWYTCGHQVWFFLKRKPNTPGPYQEPAWLLEFSNIISHRSIYICWWSLQEHIPVKSSAQYGPTVPVCILCTVHVLFVYDYYFFFKVNRTHRVHTKNLHGSSSSQKPFHTDQYTFADETWKNIFQSNPVHSMGQLCQFIRCSLLAKPTKPDLQYRIIAAWIREKLMLCVTHVNIGYDFLTGCPHPRW